MQTSGRYLDRLERRNGEWRISHRITVMELAQYLPRSDEPPEAFVGLGRRDHTDPSYAVLGG